MSKWAIMGGIIVPLMMNAGISPEMAQVVFRFGESVTYGLTPVMAYFIIYLAFVDKYNQGSTPIPLMKTLKYQVPYTIATAIVLGIILIVWYMVGLPLGINTLPTL